MPSKKPPATPTYIIKPPSGADSTVYIALQYYSREKKRTVQDRLAHFNLYHAVESLAPTVTNLGLERGYAVLPEHLEMAKRWLRRHGRKVTEKVPANVRRKLTAEVEARLRAELGKPLPAAPEGSVPTQPKPTRAPTLSDDVQAMLVAIDRVKQHLGGKVESGRELGLTRQGGSDWRMCSFAFSEALELATAAGIGRPKSWQSKEWVEEAIGRGYYTRKKLEAGQRAAARKVGTLLPPSGDGTPVSDV